MWKGFSLQTSISEVLICVSMMGLALTSTAVCKILYPFGLGLAIQSFVLWGNPFHRDWTISRVLYQALTLISSSNIAIFSFSLGYNMTRNPKTSLTSYGFRPSFKSFFIVLYRLLYWPFTEISKTNPSNKVSAFKHSKKWSLYKLIHARLGTETIYTTISKKVKRIKICPTMSSTSKRQWNYHRS